MKITILLFLGILAFSSNISSQSYQWWTARYSSPASGSQDTSSAITIDLSGNVYVAGWANGFNTGTDIVLIKYNSITGDTAWVRQYSSPGVNEDKALAITSDNLGFIYITGYSFQPSRDIITLKFDAAGNQIWVSTFNGSNNGGDYGFAIVVDGAGNVYVAGRSDEVNLQHFTTIKYNSAGTQQWANVYSGSLSQSFDQAQDIALDNSGNVYVTGFSTVGQNFHTSDYLTIKYNSSGNLQWEKRYNGTGNDEDVAVRIVALNNAVYVTGRTDSLDGNFNYYTVKYRDSNGDILASASYCGILVRQIDYAVCMTSDNTGNVYVTGTSRGSTNSTDYATVKYDQDLNQVWAARYEGTGADIPAKVVTSGSSVFVTGSSEGVNGKDFLTVKYNSSGIQAWEMRFNGPGSVNDFASALAVDQFENVYVTGSAGISSTENDIFTLRYSPIPIGIAPISGNVPQSFELYQNYPNPFNPTTNIRIDIPSGESRQTKLIVYDVLGKVVTTLVNENLKPGSYLVSWNGSGYSSGIFFYKIIAGDISKTNRMILVK
ncbi:MAG: SBBP repeat-containing protein [Ignavibacteria bacterium]